MLPRSAGILIPLFSIRTRDDLGRGEILDLAPMIDFALSMGHRVIQLLPLDETGPGDLSPYSAMSVMAIDPMYISISGLPGVGRVVLGARARGGRRGAIRAERAIIRREKFRFARARVPATVVHARGRTRAAQLDAFIEANSYWIHDYALFRALKDRFNWTSWETWPAEIAKRDPAALARARRELADAIEMYVYWQFIAHRQWSEMRAYACVARRIHRRRPRVLAVPRQRRGVGEPGRVRSDAHCRCSARRFQSQGTAMGPAAAELECRCARRDSRCCAQRARHASSLYDLVRIDHVVGLYRTFNFGSDPDEPGNFTPVNEDEQRRQGEEVIRVIKQEAGATELMAEDLGTVPPWVRESLTRLGVPGYKVMQWERDWGHGDEPFVSPEELSRTLARDHRDA